jgi:hypothetical protein
MPLAYIYDAVRTPRSRSKQALAAFAVSSLSTWLAGLLKSLESRHEFDTSHQ